MFRPRRDAHTDIQEQIVADERKFGAASQAQQEQMPLIYWIGWWCAQKTHGSARLDLVRPRFPAVEPGNLLRTVPRSRRSQMSQFTQQGQLSPQQASYDQGGRGLFGIATGARVKVMRHILFGLPKRLQGRRIVEEEQSRTGGVQRRVYEEVPGTSHAGAYRDPVLQREPDFGAAAESIKSALSENFKEREKPWFDFGVGVNLELDDGDLQPAARLKVKDFFSIKLFPEPMFKIQKRLRLGPSSMGVRVNYELPLAGAENFWAPPARLMVRVDNHMGGFRLSPGGADFDEHVVQLGDNTSIRAAASVDFPRSLPLEEGDRFFGWRVRRLGIKTKW